MRERCDGLRGAGWSACVALLALGCNTSGSVLDHRDGGVDASLDGSADDAARSDAGPTMGWTLEEAATRYCDMVIAAQCEAFERCAGCARECRGENMVRICTDSFQSNQLPGLAYFDAARIEQRIQDRIAYLSTCTDASDAADTGAWFYAAQVLEAGLGEDCVSTVQRATCAEGMGVCRDGRCVPLPGPGESCAGGGNPLPCAPPLECADGTCRFRVEDGSSCAVDAECMPPSRCLSGVCRPLGAEGASCTEHGECLPHLGCVGGACTVPTACAVDGSGCGFGALCNASTEGRCDDAAPFLFDACGRPGDPSACAEGLVCGADGRCAEAPRVGEPCVSTTGECALGLYCDGGTCTPEIVLGEPCVAIGWAVECQGGYCGPEGVCAAYAALGEPCDPVARRGACDPALAYCSSSSMTCTSRGDVGEPCTSRSCREGLACAEGTCVVARGAACDVGPSEGVLRPCGAFASSWCRPTTTECTCALF